MFVGGLWLLLGIGVWVEFVVVFFCWFCYYFVGGGYLFGDVFWCYEYGFFLGLGGVVVFVVVVWCGVGLC